MENELNYPEPGTRVQVTDGWTSYDRMHGTVVPIPDGKEGNFVYVRTDIPHPAAYDGMLLLTPDEFTVLDTPADNG